MTGQGSEANLSDLLQNRAQFAMILKACRFDYAPELRESLEDFQREVDGVVDQINSVVLLKERLESLVRRAHREERITEEEWNICSEFFN